MSDSINKLQDMHKVHFELAMKELKTMLDAPDDLQCAQAFVRGFGHMKSGMHYKLGFINKRHAEAAGTVAAVISLQLEEAGENVEYISDVLTAFTHPPYHGTAETLKTALSPLVGVVFADADYPDGTPVFRAPKPDSHESKRTAKTVDEILFAEGYDDAGIDRVFKTHGLPKIRR